MNLQCDLHQEGEEALEELRKMEAWIKKAQSLSAYIKVTRLDYLKFGHLTPKEWLHDKANYPEVEEGPEQEDYEDYMHYEEDFYYEDELDLHWEDDPQEFELEGHWPDPDAEPLVVEFGNKVYPRQHVQAAQQYLKGE